MHRAAFTLLETIIVVALIVAISAIALPSLALRVTAGRVGHAVLCIETSAAMARADAMELGVPRVLVAEWMDDEWVLFTDELSSRDTAQRGDDRQAGQPGMRDPGARHEVGSFAGVDFVDQLPAIQDTGVGGPGAEQTPAPGGDSGPDPADPRLGTMEPRELAVFFPDGSCRTEAPIYLLGRDGSRRVIRLGALASRLDVRVLPNEQDEVRARGESEPGGALLRGGGEDGQ